MTSAIKIEGLSKKYIIGHERQESYTALRDVLAHKARGIKQRLLNPLSPNQENIETEEFWALRDINLDIKQGDRIGLIGRNGAGKSTLLKVLSRITEPTSGRAHIHGRLASLLEVGTGFHPELSGRENIFLNGAIMGMRRQEIKNKFDEIIAFSDIEKFLDTPVKRYSSGMYVRLAFAVAAHLEPEVLVVDEVLAVGDSEFQKKCLGKMQEVGSEGRTVIFVSHNMGAISQLCSKAVLLESGTIAEVGETNHIINTYLTSTQKNNQPEDLAILHREQNLGIKARISACNLYNSNEIQTNIFSVGEPFTVECQCIALEDCSRLQFIVGINSMMDQRITTNRSPGIPLAFDLKAGDHKKGRLKINNLHLNPGTYTLTLGLRTLSEGYDRLQNIVSFTVETSKHNTIETDEIMPYGLIHLANPEWSIK